MSEPLPNIQIPNLLYWEIMQGAEENNRTLEEELISRLWQTTILTVALSKEKGEEDLLALCKSIFGNDPQKRKPTDLQLEFTRLLTSTSLPASRNRPPKSREKYLDNGVA